ncbi:hypothetical protein RMCBS344292_04753 [Rhizopus microsporus]|nr:hypothetical protein RMCBS344292_04753 [Rhizopus microsporus]
MFVMLALQPLSDGDLLLISIVIMIHCPRLYQNSSMNPGSMTVTAKLSYSISSVQFNQATRQVGFPGGKSEPSDKDDLHTVIRECKEEIGLDLGSSAFIHLATLDPRAIKKYDDDSKVVMILVPHVFLQVTPQTPSLSVPNSEIAEAIWVPLRYLLSNPIIPFDAITTVNEKIKKLWPSSVLVPAIALKQTTDGPHLWGMTLRMTQEVVGLPLSKNAIITTLTAEEIEKYKSKM